MKTFAWMNGVLGFGMLMAAGVAGAATEKWSGDGAIFGRDGTQAGTYRLELTNTEISPEQTRNDVVVTAADGTVQKFGQVSHRSGNSFTTVGDSGRGGGSCFGEGLCQLYMEQESGTAYAITLVKDGDDQIRLMKTELKNGQATRFFREKLSRVR